MWLKPVIRAHNIRVSHLHLAIMSYFIVCVLMLPVGFVLATNTTCPTWLYYNNRTQQCECGYSTSLIECDQKTETVEIWDGYCVTYSGEDQFYAGVCPLRHRKNKINRMVSKLPTNPHLLNDDMCKPYNREGLLCGGCRKGYGPAVYSLSLDCADCSKFSLLSAIALYLLVVYLPITILFIITITFQLKIMSFPIMAYILFSQGLSVVMEYNQIVYNSILAGCPISYQWLIQIMLIPLEACNLHFFKSIVPPFCFSEKLTGIDILLFSSLTSSYPIMLVITTWLLMELHSKNYQLIHKLWRPFRFILKKFHNQEISGKAVISAFASFIFLSSTTTMYVVYIMTESVTILSNTDHEFVYKVGLYFDPETGYKSQKHIIYLMLASIQCIVIVLFPSVLLVVYPTRVYKVLSQRLSPRKQLAITAFAEALNYNFKDGLNGTRDYRSLAGIVLSFLPLFCISSNLIDIATYKGYNFNISVFMSAALVSLLLGFLRPFKSSSGNFLGPFYFALFGIFALVQYLWKISLYTDTEALKIVFIALYILSQIPAYIWFGYSLFLWIYKRFSAQTEF